MWRFKDDCGMISRHIHINLFSIKFKCRITNICGMRNHFRFNIIFKVKSSITNASGVLGYFFPYVNHLQIYVKDYRCLWSAHPLLHKLNFLKIKWRITNACGFLRHFHVNWISLKIKWRTTNACGMLIHFHINLICFKIRMPSYFHINLISLRITRRIRHACGQLSHFHNNLLSLQT